MHCILTSKSNAPTYTVHLLVFKLLICCHDAGEYNMKHWVKYLDLAALTSCIKYCTLSRIHCGK